MGRRRAPSTGHRRRTADCEKIWVATASRPLRLTLWSQAHEMVTPTGIEPVFQP